MDALTSLEQYLIDHGHAFKGRDPREHGHARKTAAEKRLYSIVRQYFARQRKRVTDWARLHEAMRAWGDDIDALLVNQDDLEWFEANVLKFLMQSAGDGVNLFSQQVSLGLDYTLVNAEAAKWARAYSSKLVKNIGASSREAVRQAIGAFVDTPGMTMGDVVAALPFDDVRAWRVAVTETTRAYAKAAMLGAQELAAEFPDVEVTKRWFTNNDDRVCPVCAPLAKTGDVPLNYVYFEDDEGDGTEPPAHVNCRCWVDYRTKINSEN